MFLRGDFSHWFEDAPLLPGDDKMVSCRLDVAPGVYTYKLRTERNRWFLHPENPRTRTCDGVQSNLVCVGGTIEPLMHAPVSPFLFLDESSRLVIRAGLRRGFGELLWVRYHDGEVMHYLPLSPAGNEDEHLLFSGVIPFSGEGGVYVFELADGTVIGGGDSQPFAVPRGICARQFPDWWRSAVIYSVFLDRFAQAGADSTWDGLPWGEQHFAGGNLTGVLEKLDYLCDLGVSVIHLTPFVRAESPHYYDSTDLLSLDPRLGTIDDLRSLVDAVHARGLKIIFDFPLNHVHYRHAFFQDVCDIGPASPYFEWFLVEQWPFRIGVPDISGYAHYQHGRWQEPMLNLANSEVRAHILEVLAHWGSYGPDGFRLDACADLPLDFVAEISRKMWSQNPQIAIIGEVVPSNIHRWHSVGLHAATDFLQQQGLDDWLLRGQGGKRAASVWQRAGFRVGGSLLQSIAFCANHDQARFLSRCGNPALARLALLVVLTRAAVPLLYGGDELDVCSSSVEKENFEGHWGDRCPLPWSVSLGETHSLVRSLCRLRRDHLAFCTGEEEFAWDIMESDDAVVAFWREDAHESFLVVGNGSNRTVSLSLPSAMTEVLALAGAHVERDSLNLPPYAGIVLTPLAEVSLPDSAILQEVNETLALESFVQGRCELETFPTHLYLTVTEACNLRCRHCITRTPARMSRGLVRTMMPWVLDELTEPIRAAKSIGFSHGGESLASTSFLPLLRSIQTIRSGGTLHLVTNGMLLTPERTEELVSLGVNSIAISLDGSSAETNDSIRTGSRFAVVSENIRRVMSLRKSQGWDLRLGISSVVMAQNVHELELLGILVASWGCDWLKLEELFPVNAYARASLVTATDPRVVRGMQLLRDRAAAEGFVLVDHLGSFASCRLKNSREYGEFLAADGFANRTHFLPCAAAWTIACVDPDGTVRASGYDAPALGNLCKTPFADLWNGEAAMVAREAQLRQCEGASQCLLRTETVG